MSDLVVHIDVPEAELPLVQKGLRAAVQPVAFPELQMEGQVEWVGSIAQSVEGRPEWQKYFHVIIALPRPDPRLRSGMSVSASVLAEDRADAVLVPRAAVEWRNSEALCRVLSGGKVEERAVLLGRADARDFIVLRGLEPGERVVIE